MDMSMNSLKMEAATFDRCMERGAMLESRPSALKGSAMSFKKKAQVKESSGPGIMESMAGAIGSIFSRKK